jgi:hypothetical protein
MSSCNTIRAFKLPRTSPICRNCSIPGSEAISQFGYPRNHENAIKTPNYAAAFMYKRKKKRRNQIWKTGNFGERNQKGKAVHETEQNKTKFNNQKQATYISPIPKILSVTNKQKKDNNNSWKLKGLHHHLSIPVVNVLSFTYRKWESKRKQAQITGILFDLIKKQTVANG